MGWDVENDDDGVNRTLQYPDAEEAFQCEKRASLDGVQCAGRSSLGKRASGVIRMEVKRGRLALVGDCCADVMVFIASGGWSENMSWKMEIGANCALNHVLNVTVGSIVSGSFSLTWFSTGIYPDAWQFRKIH